MQAYLHRRTCNKINLNLNYDKFGAKIRHFLPNAKFLSNEVKNINFF